MVLFGGFGFFTAVKRAEGHDTAYAGITLIKLFSEANNNSELLECTREC